ncbi:hypothetical protein PQO03_19025 [Lentisphaera profundi]|uniref:Phospholipase/carboxylesterase/thioesterase domain-containing protein n=1 Tax=Lentisphaera profundi TaxID=1658616 RepID=A0ABY7VV28_9BACT|nr:alpha/beta fold hydrolase [Lentisphaera profundi]WDE97922.1 hypothetical protein PQO03_19025 [Lentisphaera profundi]
MRFFLVLFFITVHLSASSSLESLPKPIFNIKVPQTLPEKFNEHHLRKLSPSSLRHTASQHAQSGKLQSALQFQYWACNIDETQGLYDLACYYALNKDIDSSVYFLQKAALNEGVDYSWALKDKDLIPVMNSKYWEKLRPWLKKCFSSWHESKYFRSPIIKPSTGESEVLLIGLHGYGSVPEDFASDEDQGFADKHKVTFMGISGSVPLGRNSFMWSEDIDKDSQHIFQILKQSNIDLKKEKRPVILIGFSQGAQLSTELLARYPHLFKGIITLCPGARYDSQLPKVKESVDLSKKKAVIICGSNEHKGNLELSKSNFTWLTKHKAIVRYSKIKGLGHSFPPNFYDKLNDYLIFILK